MTAALRRLRRYLPGFDFVLLVPCATATGQGGLSVSSIGTIDITSDRLAILSGEGGVKWRVEKGESMQVDRFGIFRISSDGPAYLPYVDFVFSIIYLICEDLFSQGCNK